MSDTTALSVVPRADVELDDNPAHLMRRATDVAGVCRGIATKTAVTIQGRKYVRVEGWQAIAVAHGCVASARDVQRIDGGIRAIGEVRRAMDGAVMSSAEGFVGDDEKTWGGRAEFAKRAMAQTRAISRACRSAFAHVVVMMDAGLETTPAEEMEAVEAERTAPKQNPQPAQAAGRWDLKPTWTENGESKSSVSEIKPKSEPSADTGGAAATPSVDGEMVVEGVTIKQVREKDGVNQKSGKPWHAWFVEFADGTEAGTFSQTIGELAVTCKESGDVVDVRVKPGKKPGSLELLDIEPFSMKGDVTP